MTAKNDITGDSLTSRVSSDKYRDNWERIFGKRNQNGIERAILQHQSEKEEGNQQDEEEKHD